MDAWNPNGNLIDNVEKNRLI